MPGAPAAVWLSTVRRSSSVKSAFFFSHVFGPNGVLQKIEKLDAAAGQDISIVERTTPTAGKDLSFLEQMVGNVGRFSSGKKGSGPGK